jgi:hypothetical protein
VAPGLWQFTVAAPPGTGGERLTARVLLGDQPIFTGNGDDASEIISAAATVSSAFAPPAAIDPRQRAQFEDMSEKDVSREIKRLEKLMMEHARNLEFEKAARVRDQLALLKQQAFGAPGSDNVVLLASAPTTRRM